MAACPQPAPVACRAWGLVWSRLVPGAASCLGCSSASPAPHPGPRPQVLRALPEVRLVRASPGGRAARAARRVWAYQAADRGVHQRVPVPVKMGHQEHLQGQTCPLPSGRRGQRHARMRACTTRTHVPTHTHRHACICTHARAAGLRSRTPAVRSICSLGRRFWLDGGRASRTRPAPDPAPPPPPLRRGASSTQPCRRASRLPTGACSATRPHAAGAFCAPRDALLGRVRPGPTAKGGTLAARPG
jgi:hypothetical protein